MDKEEQATPRNINKEFDSSLTPGERLSDALAKFGGSLQIHRYFHGHNSHLDGH